ncbi:hypothetical protein BDZ88DRAFT_291958 [Geranomyces variabilis]|nr:hypothetical protein BDZ88DRAFT_291958 [Geranomyces variabilis]
MVHFQGTLHRTTDIPAFSGQVGATRGGNAPCQEEPPLSKLNQELPRMPFQSVIGSGQQSCAELNTKSVSGQVGGTKGGNAPCQEEPPLSKLNQELPRMPFQSVIGSGHHPGGCKTERLSSKLTWRRWEMGDGGRKGDLDACSQTCEITYASEFSPAHLSKLEQPRGGSRNDEECWLAKVVPVSYSHRWDGFIGSQQETIYFATTGSET